MVSVIYLPNRNHGRGGEVSAHSAPAPRAQRHSPPTPPGSPGWVLGSSAPPCWRARCGTSPSSPSRASRPCSSRRSRGPPRSSRFRRLPLCSRPLRALPAFGAPSGAFRFLSPPRPALDLFLCAGLCKIFVRSRLLAKLFTIYVVCSPLASPLGRLGSIPCVLRFGHCTTPESHGVYLDPTQFHRTSNITETNISKDLRPRKTRQTALQICSA